MKPIKNSAVLRIMVSLVVVFLIPVVILYILFTNNMIKAVRDEVEEIISNDLNAAIQINDAKLKELDDTIKMFQRGNGYQSYLTREFAYDKTGTASNMQMESDIAYIYLLNHIAEDFFVVMPSDNALFSVSGMFRIPNYLNAYLSPMDPNIDLQERIVSVKKTDLFQVSLQKARSGSGDYFLFLYALPRSVQGNHAVAAFCVKTETLSSAFQPRAEDFKTSTFVFDGSGQYLYSYNADGSLTENIISAFMDGSLNYSEYEDASAGAKYVVFQKKSEYNGWSYITLLPDDNALYQSIFHIDQFSSLYLVLISAFGVFAICWFFWINYKPIRTLRKKAQSTIPESGDSTVKSPYFTDEFHAISNVLTILQERNADLNTSNTRNMQEVASFRLQRLMNGYYTDVEEFNADCEQIGLAYHGDYFYISIIQFQTFPEDLSAIPSLIRQEFADSEVQLLPRRKRKELALIHCVKTPQEIRSEPFFSILGYLHDQLALTAVIGIGHLHKGTSSINKSFMQARTSLEHHALTHASVIDYDEVLQYYSDSNQTQQKKLREFAYSVQGKDINAMRSHLTALLGSLRGNNSNLMTTRFICFDIIKILMSMTEGYQKNSYLLTEILMQISYSSNKDDILLTVTEACSNVLTAMQQDEKEADDALLTQIKAYIEENFCRCDFSLQEVSDHFEMMPSTIGNYFKSKAGFGLLEYLIDKRVQKAKDLLRNSDMSIKDIGISVGYYNNSSFIRRFREHEGITPNAYRFQKRSEEL